MFFFFLETLLFFANKEGVSGVPPRARAASSASVAVETSVKRAAPALRAFFSRLACLPPISSSVPSCCGTRECKNCCDVATLVVIAKAQGLCQMIILLPFQKLENIASWGAAHIVAGARSTQLTHTHYSTALGPSRNEN